MLGPFALVVALLHLISYVYSFPYDPTHIDFNLNQNKAAKTPLEYWGEWENHTYNPSPSNWRFPYYTVWYLEELDSEQRLTTTALPRSLREWRSYK